MIFIIIIIFKSIYYLNFNKINLYDFYKIYLQGCVYACYNIPLFIFRKVVIPFSTHKLINK